jgi:toxin-antitoxin system PIN domain toxin
MKIVDVNVLVYIASLESPHHKTLHQWWETAMNGSEPIGLCWPALVGFVKVMSDPRIMPKPVPLNDCIDRVNLWLENRTTELIRETEDHWSVFQLVMLSSSITGKLVHDAHLAALAISRGATLVSCDTDFARFRHLRWENPLTQSRVT